MKLGTVPEKLSSLAINWQTGVFSKAMKPPENSDSQQYENGSRNIRAMGSRGPTPVHKI
jgi:hypothetical protein